MECAKEITCRATIDKNMERMGRLLGLETNVQTVFASLYYTSGFALTALSGGMDAWPTALAWKMQVTNAKNVVNRALMFWILVPFDLAF